MVPKGFSQVEGLDYSETFAPVAKMNSIRLVLSIAASRKWTVHQMDVKCAFLHGDLQEYIYMEQPIGFIQDSSLVCKLKKYLYGLKKSPHSWYDMIDHLFLNLGFKHCQFDHNIYVFHVHNDTLIVALYVDDLVITGNNVDFILNLKKQLVYTFEMTKLGLFHFFLNIQIL